MKMGLEFCNQSMQTILGFLNKPPAQAAALVQSVHKMCAWMKPERFQKVCDKVAEDLSPGRAPTYKQFVGAYNALADTLNWKAHDALSRVDCGACGGKGWTYIKLYNPTLGDVDLFNKPCPQCRSNHPLHEMPVPKGWIEAENMELTYQIKPTAGLLRFLESVYGVTATTPELALLSFQEKSVARTLKVKPHISFGGINFNELAGRLVAPVTRAESGSPASDGEIVAQAEADSLPF